jgi:hypothetical protein
MQGYALHVPDQVIFRERATLPHHNSSGVYGRHYIDLTGHVLSLRSVTRETVRNPGNWD